MAEPVAAFVCYGEPACFNCGDESWHERDEQSIRNAKGQTFCSVECADHFDTRAEREAAEREREWCPSCGYDRHEHAPGCEAGP